MATNIGTQAAKLIEDAYQSGMMLNAIGKLSGAIQTGADAECALQIVEFIAEINNERMSNLKHFLEREVLPLVAHISKSYLAS